MYKIIKDGATVAVTDKLNYIRQNANGVFISCTEKEAQGVAVNNTPYNIYGREEMNDCETVIVFEVDGGAQLQACENSMTELEALIVDHEYKLALMETGVL